MDIKIRCQKWFPVKVHGQIDAKIRLWSCLHVIGWAMVTGHARDVAAGCARVAAARWLAKAKPWEEPTTTNMCGDPLPFYGQKGQGVLSAGPPLFALSVAAFFALGQAQMAMRSQGAANSPKPPVSEG